MPKGLVEMFQTYGLKENESASVVGALRRRPADWVSFMMRFELGLEPPALGRSWKCALTIAGSWLAAAFGIARLLA